MTDLLDIRQGEALAVLCGLPEASVQCCVTSPPYWGLRDYGTGKWIDGVADCDHIYNHGVQGNGQRAGRSFTGRAVYKSTCGKCGAVRVDEQLGLESTPQEYTARLVTIFREVRRVLRDDGIVWVNLGDSYNARPRQRKTTDEIGPKQRTNAGSNSIGSRNVLDLKPKDLVGIPWRVAFALQEDGWYLRQDIIWSKPNPMPESVRDRCTKAHEYIFLLSKSPRYYYEADAIKEPASPDSHARYARGRSDHHKWADGGPGNQTIATNRPGSRFAGVNPKCVEFGLGIKQNSSFSASVKDLVDFRNKRSVWTIVTKPTREAHFATFPLELARTCILAGCPVDGLVW